MKQIGCTGLFGAGVVSQGTDEDAIATYRRDRRPEGGQCLRSGPEERSEQGSIRMVQIDRAGDSGARAGCARQWRSDQKLVVAQGGDGVAEVRSIGQRGIEKRARERAVRIEQVRCTGGERAGGVIPRRANKPSIPHLCDREAEVIGEVRRGIGERLKVRRILCVDAGCGDDTADRHEQ